MREQRSIAELSVTKNARFRTLGGLSITKSRDLTNDDVRNQNYDNYGQAASMTISLFPSTIGAAFQFFVSTASQTTDFEPPAGESFLVDGTAYTAGNHADISNSYGDKFMFKREKDSSGNGIWVAYTIQGGVSDGGA
jgi:hypothetical protein